MYVWCLWRSEEDTGSSWTVLYIIVSHYVSAVEPNLSPLQEQQEVPNCQAVSLALSGSFLLQVFTEDYSG